VAASGSVDGHRTLLIFPLVDAGSLTSAALIAATAEAVGNSLPVAEYEPLHLTDDVLRQWQQPVPEAAPRVREPGAASDGRWFWLLALVLLIVEAWLRKRRTLQQPREQPTVESAHERVA
jgi:hypothetical protein